MAYIIDTTTLPDVLEHASFTGVVGIIQADPNVADPPITSITVTRGAQYTLGPNITSNISGNSVTISGQYTDNFTTGGITFLDKDVKAQTVQKFTDVPADFSTVISYIPSGVSTGDAVYTITVNGNIAGNVTQTVINNYSTGRDSLVALVAKGKF